jgi:hypothetical protein
VSLGRWFLLAGSALIAGPLLLAQSPSMDLPAQIPAGGAFSIPTSGSGQGTLTIVGPGQALRRQVQLGSAISLPAGILYNAGEYVAILSNGSDEQVGMFAVTPAQQPSSLSFLAEPSRLPVDLQDGISGTVYVFDVYHNLIVKPMPVSFNLTASSGPSQTRTVTTRYGVGWTRMNSASREGSAHFVAQTGGVTSTRVIDEVPGDPCNLSMTATPDGGKVKLQTAPVRDCSGNPIPDGTVVTFTANFDGRQSTVDVPLKRDVAEVEMPLPPGATVSVASGVVAGNEIHWSGQ